MSVNIWVEKFINRDRHQDTAKHSKLTNGKWLTQFTHLRIPPDRIDVHIVCIILGERAFPLPLHLPGTVKLRLVVREKQSVYVLVSLVVTITIYKYYGTNCLGVVPFFGVVEPKLFITVKSPYFVTAHNFVTMGQNFLEEPIFVPVQDIKLV